MSAETPIKGMEAGCRSRCGGSCHEALARSGVLLGAAPMGPGPAWTVRMVTA